MTRDIRPARRLLMAAALLLGTAAPLGMSRPVAANGSAPTDDEVAAATVAHSAVDTNRPEPGDDVEITLPAETFTAGETVNVYLYSAPVTLGQPTAGTDGELDATVTIPQATTVGGHTIVAVGATSGEIVAIPITVTASVTAGATDIDYDQPGQYEIQPCSSATDTDCIVSMGYVVDSGLVEAGYLAAAPDPGFTCADGHIFNSAGTYWNFPGLTTEEGGSTILASPSLTTPGFNHNCSRSGDRVVALERVAERVFVGLFSAVDQGGGNYNQASVPKPGCPSGSQCSIGLGPAEDTVFELTLRVSGFAMAYAYASTSGTEVEIQALEDGDALVTVRGMALDIPGVGDSTSFSEGSLRTTEQADFLANTWFFQMKNANDPGFPSDCSTHGFPVISGNHAWGGEPEWDSVANELRFNMGAPHLRPDGEVFEGIYEARIPVAYAECLWGIDPTALVTDLEVAVIDEDGTERAEGEFVASITIVDDMLHIDADGFHFSEPDVVVRSTGGFVSLDKPVRILNTRTGDPIGADDLGGSGTPHTLQVTGDLIPATATAVALNVTVVDGQANDFGGYVTVYPCGTKPEASNLNFTTGQTIPNSVIAPLSATGTVCLYVYGQAHLLVDVSGYFTAGLEPVDPTRILNTRTGDPIGADDLGGSGTPHTLQVTGDLIPATATAVALNVTVVDGQANDFGGYVTVYPCGTKPEASNLNFTTGQTIPNSVIAPLSATGTVCLYVYGQAHLLVDVSGYLAG